MTVGADALAGYAHSGGSADESPAAAAMRECLRSGTTVRSKLHEQLNPETIHALLERGSRTDLPQYRLCTRRQPTNQWRGPLLTAARPHVSAILAHDRSRRAKQRVWNGAGR